MTDVLDGPVVTSDGRAFRLVECEPPTRALSEVPERVPYVMFGAYPDVMSREQAAEALDVNVKDMGELLRSGRVRAYRDGRRWRVPKVSLIEYVEQRIAHGWWDGGEGC